MGIHIQKKTKWRAGLAAAVILTLFCMSAGFADKGKAPPAAGPEIEETAWDVRCADQKGPLARDKAAPAQCEVFKRLDVSKEHSRVAEFAAGFPDPKSGNARGAVALPLGIMLDQDVSMKIDNNKPVAFRLQYCTNAGCFSFLSLNETVIDEMKKGDTLHFYFKSMTGQNVDLTLKLSGFGKALKRLM